MDPPTANDVPPAYSHPEVGRLPPPTGPYGAAPAARFLVRRRSTPPPSYGIYVSLKGEWSPLHPDQLEAFETARSDMKATGRTFVKGTNSRGGTYAVKVTGDEYHIQLGDGEFHRVLRLTPP